MRSLALSRWPGQGSIQGWGSWPCLACLPADSSGTVSWLPAKLPPLSAGWHPGPIARGPAGGQQLECRRAVIPARRLKAGPVLGLPASHLPLPPPLHAPPSGLRSQAQLYWPSALLPKFCAPVQSWGEQIRRGCSEKHSQAVGPQDSAEPPAASTFLPRKGSQLCLRGLSYRSDISPALSEGPCVQGCVGGGGEGGEDAAFS